MRIEGWESKLNDYVQEAHGLSFVWGETDCILWCAEWVRLATGNDHASNHRGMYKSDRQAASYLKKLGFHSLENAVDQFLLSVPVKMCRRGDLLLSNQDGLGICTGIEGAFLTEKGLTTFRTLECTKAWSVE